jgi:hypothetical protein
MDVNSLVDLIMKVFPSLDIMRRKPAAHSGSDRPAHGRIDWPSVGDIDFHGGFIEVRRAVVMGRETTTKSHKIRRVDMSRQLMAELKRRNEIRQLEAMNGKELLPWVFLSPGGIRLDERNLRRSWYRCLEEAEITVRFHDLRHTFVSLLIQKGVHPKYIQEQAGHSSIQVTMDTYGHLFPNLNREWVNKLDDNEGFVPVSYPAQVQDLNGTSSALISHWNLRENVWWRCPGLNGGPAAYEAD